MGLKYPNVIYRAIYLCVRYVSLVYQFSKDRLRKLRDELHKLCHEFTPANKIAKPIRVEKRPRHMTFLLGGEEPSPRDLANAVLWCLAAGISFVSFYDYKGILKRRECELRSAVDEIKGASDHVIWHDGANAPHRNGLTCRKIHVKVLGADRSVADLCRRLASTTKDARFDADSLGRTLEEQFEFPNPDLGVCCGQTLMLHGYPPWQIRVTEFFTIRSHHGFSLDSFVDLLHRYSKCEQRFGK